MLFASDPGATDVRLKQISDFGGKETMALLGRLAPVGNFPSIITESLNFLRTGPDVVSEVLVTPLSSKGTDAISDPPIALLNHEKGKP